LKNHKDWDMEFTTSPRFPKWTADREYRHHHNPTKCRCERCTFRRIQEHLQAIATTVTMADAAKMFRVSKSLLERALFTDWRSPLLSGRLVKIFDEPQARAIHEALDTANDRFWKRWRRNRKDEETKLAAGAVDDLEPA